jgi:hypothetical protein
VLEPRDALPERAAVRRLGDAEEVVVVAALLARILDDRGLVGRVDRGERDATNILVQGVFERADAPLGVVRGLVRRGRRRGTMAGGARS